MAKSRGDFDDGRDIEKYFVPSFFMIRLLTPVDD